LATSPSCPAGAICFFDWSTSGQQKERTNPGHLQSVLVTAAHHALAGQVVKVVRCKRYRDEPHLVVELPDGSRQLIATRNTELADARSSLPGLRFTPGSLRALAEVIRELQHRANRSTTDVVACAEESSAVDIVFAGGTAAGREGLDGTAATSTPPQSKRTFRKSR
jgi:hypothetical protein